MSDLEIGKIDPKFRQFLTEPEPLADGEGERGGGSSRILTAIGEFGNGGLDRPNSGSLTYPEDLAIKFARMWLINPQEKLMDAINGFEVESEEYLLAVFNSLTRPSYLSEYGKG